MKAIAAAAGVALGASVSLYGVTRLVRLWSAREREATGYVMGQPVKHHTFVWRVGETPRSAKFQQLTPDQMSSAKFLYEAVDSGLIVDVFEIGDELFAASRKGAHNPTWAREVKASASGVTVRMGVGERPVTLHPREMEQALKHFAPETARMQHADTKHPSFDNMSWNQFVSAVMLAFPADLTVVKIERGPENLEAMLEFVTPDEFSVSVRVGWDGRDVTAVEIDSDGRMLNTGGGLLDTPPRAALLAAVLRMPCVSADQVASRLTALLAQFADTREYPETCGACGTALTDLGAHGVGCPVCAAAELDALDAAAELDTDSLKLSASELADERAITAARRARWGGATSWPPSAAPAWLAIGGRVQAPGHDDLDTGAGSNRGTVARIDADQGRVVVETDDGQLEEWPLAGVAPEVDP